MSKHYLYILRCEDGYLYTGITADVEKRIWEHRNGLCRNTKNRGKIGLVFKESFCDIYQAAKKEKEIKGGRREKKEALINAVSIKNKACSE